jgi:hypothetical protein
MKREEMNAILDRLAPYLATLDATPVKTPAWTRAHDRLLSAIIESTPQPDGRRLLFDAVDAHLAKRAVAKAPAATAGPARGRERS